MKFPGQAYVGLPLCKDSQKEHPVEAESREEEPSKGSPMNHVGAPLLRKKTESALYECGGLLASLALGADVRKLHGTQAFKKTQPKEEKKEEGPLQWVSRCQASTRQPTAGRAPSDGPSVLPPSASSLSSKTLSTKCLLQADEEVLSLGSTRISCGPMMLTPDPRSTTPESSYELIPESALKNDCGVLRSMSPALLEQTGGNLPPCAAAGDKERRHAWMGCKETALQPQSRWQQLGKRADGVIEGEECFPFSNDFD